MLVLVDENAPLQLLDPLQHVLRRHVVHHVESIGWKGKKDRSLIPDAAIRGYQVFLTKDVNQFAVPEECDAIKRSGMHHVRFRQGDGLAALGRAVGSVIVALHPVMEELVAAPSQRLVEIRTATRDYTVTDPNVRPPSAYWPGTSHVRRP